MYSPFRLRLLVLVLSMVGVSVALAGDRQIYYDHTGRPVGTVKATSSTQAAAKPSYPITPVAMDKSVRPMSKYSRSRGLYRRYSDPYGHGYGYAGYGSSPYRIGCGPSYCPPYFGVYRSCRRSSGAQFQLTVLR